MSQVDEIWIIHSRAVFMMHPESLAMMEVCMLSKSCKVALHFAGPYYEIKYVCANFEPGVPLPDSFSE